jgi:adenosylhomocysteine nucleosidase
MTPERPAFLVGFAAEARIARSLGWPVAIGGGTQGGAAFAARDLIRSGAEALISFGLAAGLDRAVRPGAIVVAESVISHDHRWLTDPSLNARLGGGTGHVCLGLDGIVASPDDKYRLGHETGAAIGDIESAAVAAAATAAKRPFAVLRAVCDPVERALPAAALIALDSSGRIAALRLARSVISRPGQIGALISLARDATLARRALRDRIRWILAIEANM